MFLKNSAKPFLVTPPTRSRTLSKLVKCSLCNAWIRWVSSRSPSNQDINVLIAVVRPLFDTSYPKNKSINLPTKVDSSSGLPFSV